MNTKTVAVNPDHVALFKVPVSFILDLRHLELRSGLPKESASFDGDNEIGTIHLALTYPVIQGSSVITSSAHLVEFGTSGIVCCASFMHRAYKKQPAWQLRGMATAEKYHKCGFGKKLLNSALPYIANNSGIRTFWCNAREIAIPFYTKQGWVCEGDFFEIADAGKHKVMSKRL